MFFSLRELGLSNEKKNSDIFILDYVAWCNTSDKCCKYSWIIIWLYVIGWM